MGTFLTGVGAVISVEIAVQYDGFTYFFINFNLQNLFLYIDHFSHNVITTLIFYRLINTVLWRKSEIFRL